MPTTVNEAESIKNIMRQYLSDGECYSLSKKLNEEVGVPTTNDSLKISLRMLHELFVSSQQIVTNNKLKPVVYTIASLHGLLVLINLILVMMLPFLVSWYIALLLITLMINLTFSPVPCPLTTLENYFRNRAGMPKIRHFIKHYFLSAKGIK